ncbi:hypothetical protein DXG03_002866 [Asterophora parasitica]|uniref:Gamma interferon inducible lysosomal thiol reductase n=1 Tax=Asterophora parasitica TaxID=117018 RepID=A0A9P7GD87_9AGAR|nr:hypothetical protein DXG03_002866 [Asterophora parasitica]
MRLLPVLSLAPLAAVGLHLPWSIFSQELVNKWRLSNDVKVPIQLGVMSRCPDALLCESVFNKVLPKVNDRIDISLVYVAKFDSEEPDFGVKCLHGREECAGNVQQLCVKKYEPEVWWEFVQCQNFEGRYRVGDPDLALKCAKTVGIDWENGKVGRCAGRDGSGKGKEGVALLKKSVTLGQSLNIKYVIHP